MTLYESNTIDYDSVAAKVRELCEKGVFGVEYESFPITGPIGEKVVQLRKPSSHGLKNEDKIKNKARFIVHSIAFRQIQLNTEGSPENKMVSINESILRDVLGRGCTEILNTLVELGYIERDNSFELSHSSRKYCLNVPVSATTSQNSTLIKYLVKLKQVLKSYMFKQFNASYPKESDVFLLQYEKNLNKFKIKDRKGFKQFIKDDIKKNANKEEYYKYVEATFGTELEIFRIDRNRRTYHILTNLKRELKPFLNIKFSIDCANSHPLLLNHLIFRSKRIPIDTAYRISDILRTIHVSSTETGSIFYHKDGTNLRKVLIERGIRDCYIAQFFDDELLYIYETTTGVFWDNLINRHKCEGVDRSLIKQTMFAEVFYSKTKTNKWKKYAQEFNKKYPNVYRLILNWKEPRYHKDTLQYLIDTKNILFDGSHYRPTIPDRTALPNCLMQLEAEIFHKILKSLFAQRICAVHIHDAIVVPAIKRTVSLQESLIKKIMMSAYAEYGLCPTLKTENYQSLDLEKPNKICLITTRAQGAENQ